MLLEDSEVTEDVPQNDEDNDAHAAAATGQLASAVTGSNSTQQLAHLYSAIKVRIRASESHESYRGVPASLMQNYIATSSSGQVAQLVEQRTENPRVGGSIPSLAITSK